MKYIFATIFLAIGVFSSWTIFKQSSIGEWSFIVLIILSVSVSILIAFKDQVKVISLWIWKLELIQKDITIKKEEVEKLAADIADLYSYSLAFSITTGNKTLDKAADV